MSMKRTIAFLIACGFLGGAGVARGDVVTDWNDYALQVFGNATSALPCQPGARVPPAPGPGQATTIDLAMVHLATHDAVQAMERRYELYGDPIWGASGSRIAAAAKAAHDVLVNLFPLQTECLDARYRDYLAAHGIPEDDEGVEAGQLAAARIIAKRVGDDRFPSPAPPPFIERYDRDTNVWRVEGSVAPIPSDDDAAAETRASSGSGQNVRWSFGANMRVSTGGQQFLPDIVRFGEGNLCASWVEDRAQTGTHKIYSSVSTDGGLTWLPDQRVDDSPVGVKALNVTLAPDGASDLVAVWEDVRSSPTWNVYLSRGTWNAGENRIHWSSSTQINTTGGTTSPYGGMTPSVVTAGENVHIAWTDWREGVLHAVYSRASTDGGLTWKREVRISDEIGDQPISSDPSCAVDHGSSADPRPVACVWNEWRGYIKVGSYPDISFARSKDGGQTWTKSVRVNDITHGYQQASKHVVAITPLKHTINVGWFNWDFTGPSQMRVSRSTDNGATWLASKSVSDPNSSSTLPLSLAAGFGEDVLTAWSGRGSDSTFNIYFRASEDAGVSWTPILRVDDDNTGVRSQGPNVASLPDGSPIVVMMDPRPGLIDNTWVALGQRYDDDHDDDD
jgi:hypothetical protein